MRLFTARVACIVGTDTPSRLLSTELAVGEDNNSIHTSYNTIHCFLSTGDRDWPLLQAPGSGRYTHCSEDETMTKYCIHQIET